MHKVTLKTIREDTLEFLKALWIPLVLFVVIVVLMLKSSILSKEETSEIILGVVFGIFIGFVVNIFKYSYDDFRNKIKLKKASIELLKADAIVIYKCFYAYENLLNKKIINDKVLPPELGLKNWNLLKQNTDFLLLSTTPPLKEICGKMSTLEDLNETVIKAYSKDRFSETLAIPMFSRTLQKKEHENLISLLMTEEEISRFKKELQLNTN